MAEPLLAEMVCPCDEHFVDYVTRRTCCVRCGRPPKRVLFLVCDITPPESGSKVHQYDGGEDRA